jgi:hypothetical protein
MAEGRTDIQLRRAQLDNSQPQDLTAVSWFNVITPALWLTSVPDWTCSCPAYSLSRFMMCKHLIR